MKISELMPIITAVLTDTRVIVTAIVIFVYLDLCCYIVRYRKKPPKPKAKKAVAAPAPKAEESSGEENGDGGEE